MFVAVPVRGAGRIVHHRVYSSNGGSVAVPVRGAGRIQLLLALFNLQLSCSPREGRGSHLAKSVASITPIAMVAVPVRGAGRIYKRIQSGAGKQDAFCDPCIKV